MSDRRGPHRSGSRSSRDRDGEYRRYGREQREEGRECRRDRERDRVRSGVSERECESRSLGDSRGNEYKQSSYRSSSSSGCAVVKNPSQRGHSKSRELTEQELVRAIERTVKNEEKAQTGAGVCHNFLKGCCRYADECRFRHEESAQARKEIDSQKEKICYAYQKGECKYGERCHYKHIEKGSEGWGGKKNRSEPVDESLYQYGVGLKAEHSSNDQETEEPLQPKEKPNFEVSGKLTEETNKFMGVVLKYAEADDAKMPIKNWRIYVFKGEENIKILHIHRNSVFLLGRERKVADIPLDHPSCSSQHAAIQYRQTTFKKKDGSEGLKTRPYIIDLESANGTFLNGEKIETRRYYEVKQQDVLKFAFSTREYVFMVDAKSEE